MANQSAQQNCQRESETMAANHSATTTAQTQTLAMMQPDNDKLHDQMNLQMNTHMSTHSHTHMEIDPLEDFGSFDSGGLESQPMPSSAPTSPRAPSYYDPVGLTIGQTSPSLQQARLAMPMSPSSTTSDQFAALAQPLPSPKMESHTKPHSFKAVHMHIQENAKLPTFNLNIDRTNSSHVTKTGPSYSNININNSSNNNNGSNTNKDIMDDLFRLDEADVSMAELFLSKESSHRRSLNANYERSRSNAATAEGGTPAGTNHRHQTFADSAFGMDRLASTTSASAVDKEIDVLTASIDPTPWSEIQQSLIYGNGSSAGARTMTNDKETRPQPQPHGYNYYPYGRHNPLPMHQKIPSPVGASRSPAPATDAVAQAVATAAQIASRVYTSPTPGPETATNAPSPMHQSVNAASTPPPLSGSQTTLASSSYVPSTIAATHPTTVTTAGRGSVSSPPFAATQAPTQVSTSTAVTATAGPLEQGRQPVPTSASRKTPHQRQSPSLAAAPVPIAQVRTIPVTVIASTAAPMVGAKTGLKQAQVQAQARVQARAPTAVAQARKTVQTVQPYMYRRANYDPPKHSATHLQNRASVTAATKKKSQYGFGGNHVVPSVPSPPPAQPTQPKHGMSVATTRKPAIGAATVAAGTGSRSIVRLDPKTKLTTATRVQPRGHAPTLPTLTPTTRSSTPTSTTSTSPSIAGMASGAGPLGVVNSGAAYERKKERAKYARVRMNESIERLSVGISLASTQSRQRKKDIETYPLCATRNRTLQNMDECTKIAEQARKWDRPSFVGTAASVIHGLNSQCEELMREMASLRVQLDSLRANSEVEANQVTPESSVGCKRPGEADWVEDQVVLQQQQQPQQQNLQQPQEYQQHQQMDAASNGAKRLKIEDGRAVAMPIIAQAAVVNATVHNTIDATTIANADANIHAHVIVNAINPTNDIPKEIESVESPHEKQEKELKVFGAVAKMLDPLSLSRCIAVSRRWKDMGVFDNESVWLNLAVRRFGFKNVREWTDRVEDEIPQDPNAHNSRQCLNKIVYRKMCQANVMPHFQHPGWKFLGKAKMPGRIAGWVFLVERSNGETLRSVQKQPNSRPNPQKSASSQRSHFASLPVVELRVLLQNIAMSCQDVGVRDQPVTVDISTRRSGGEWEEISWDPRFSKVWRNLDDCIRRENPNMALKHKQKGDLCNISQFESIVLEVSIHAKGCSTTSRFEQRGNFAKVLISLDGSTVPFVIPFLREPTYRSDSLM